MSEPPPIEPLRLAELIGAFMIEISDYGMAGMLHVLQDANMSLPRFVALSHLKRARCATISELSTRLNLALGSTSQLVDQLVQGGYVARRESDDDRRHKLVTLTPAGLALMERIYQARVSESAQILAELPPELSARFHTTLAEALAALRAVRQSRPG